MTAGRLAALHRAAFPDDPTDATAFYRDVLARPGHVTILEPHAFAVGRVAADEGEVLWIGTAPDQRRNGAATHVLRRLEAGMAARGAHVAYLEVATTNAAARALYARAGYDEVGRRRGYYADGGDALILRKALGAAASPPVSA